MKTIRAEDPVALAVSDAIHTGDVAALRLLLGEHPGLATAGLGDDGPNGTSRTLLHVVTDWPGYFPHGPQVVRLLLDAGADPNATFSDAAQTETALHWAARPWMTRWATAAGTLRAF